MSDTSQGDGWWVASDGKWYSPEQHPDYVAPVKPTTPDFAAETIAVPASTATPGPTFAPPGTPAAPATAAGAATETFEGQLLTDPSYNLPETDPPAGSKRSLILGLGAIVLVAGLGFLAFRFFTGGSAAGGADSPEAAIDQLIASVNERDAVGFVDVFDPDEIEAWFGSFTPALNQFEALNDGEQSANEFSEAYESIFNAFNYSLTGPRGEAVTYQVEPLDDDGRISRVRVDGLDFEITIAETDTAIVTAFGSDPTAIDINEFDGTRAEFRDESGGLATRLLVPGESAIDEFGEGHIDLVTVQKDGKWFVSIGYSMLELARGQGEFDEYPDPAFGRAFALVDDQTGGSESPEIAVQSMFTAIETLDYETIIELTDPLATPYLHDYQPLIDSQVDDQDRREAVRETDLRIDELELATSEWEGRTLVTMQDVSATSNEGQFMLDTASWCVTFEDEFDRERVCAEDGIAELLREADSDLDPRDFIPDETGIIVIERNGRWYLDPLGTMGYYSAQLTEASIALTNEMDGNPATELGSFFVAEGPIARMGLPATQQAESGSAAVALDVSDYSVLSGQFSDFHVAVARVVTDQSGTFVTSSDVPLDGEEWVVVYDSADSDPELPAIAATTDGQLDVELFEATVTEVGVDGFSGQLGGQGRPQVFYFAPDAVDADLQVVGATAQSIYGWESNGVIFHEPGNSSSFLSTEAFVVVTGDPGASFSLNFATVEFQPDPEPDPEPEDAFFDPQAVSDQFALLVEPEGFTFSNEQQGGFFDGCGGPDDPDVMSFIYEQPGGELLVVTPYPSFDRAVTAFDQLVNVASPCDSFEGIEVNEVVFIDIDNVRIEWQLIDDPSSVIFEHYRFTGNSVVVATADSVASLDDQLLLLEEWFN